MSGKEGPASEPVSVSPLRPLAEDLWVVERPLGIAGIQIGARMTVIRLANGDLLLHSPVELDEEICAALDALGPVRHLVAPNRVHNLFFAGAAGRFPEAVRYGAPGLAEKRPQLDFQAVLGDEPPEAWRGQIDQLHLRGMPYIGEVVFLHRASGTLVLTDSAFNFWGSAGLATRLWLRAMGIYERFGPSRMFKLLIRDRAAARASLDTVLSWDFDRVIVSHGVVLQSRGKRALRDAYKWMG